MIARFQPCNEPNGGAGRPAGKVTVRRVERPLRLVTVPDRAMEPELYRGQQVFVQNFRVCGLNYLEQRMALRVRGRVLVRRVQQMADGSIRLFGNRDGFEIKLIPPEEWERPADWEETGVLHPECTCLGPLLEGYRRDGSGGRRTYLGTHGWSN